MFYYISSQEGNEKWNSLDVPTSQLYPWDSKSTYIKSPPFFDGMVCAVKCIMCFLICPPVCIIQHLLDLLMKICSQQTGGPGFCSCFAIVVDGFPNTTMSYKTFVV